jgi:hypothetical protein
MWDASYVLLFSGPQYIASRFYLRAKCRTNSQSLHNPVQLPLPSGLCRAVCPIFTAVPGPFIPSCSPEYSICIPRGLVLSHSGCADIGLGRAEAKGLAIPVTSTGLRNFDAGVLGFFVCIGVGVIPGLFGPKGGGGLITGR